MELLAEEWTLAGSGGMLMRAERPDGEQWPPVDDEGWLTTDEVAQRLRVDADTVRSWTREGHLPAPVSDPPGAPRLRSSDLEEFLLEQR